MRLYSFTFFILLIYITTLYGRNDDNSSNEEGIVVLSSTQIVNNDYFAYGKNVEISGTVNGDVYVLGGQVLFDGKVNGDIIALAGSIEIAGIVSHNVRIMAAQASISGQIGRNLTGVTATIDISPSAVIGNNAVIISGNADLESIIKNNVRLYTSNVRISDHIGGNVMAHVGKIRLTSKANIGGSLEYWSNKDALIDSSTHIEQGVKHHPPFFYNLFHGKWAKILKISSKLATFLMNFCYSLTIGIIMIRYFRYRIDRTLNAMNQTPLQALIAGGVLLLILPLACLLLIVTVLGVPFALTLLSLTVVTFYTAKIFFILWVSKILLHRFDFQRYIYHYLLCGLIIYFLLTLIPYIGVVLSLSALLLGLGGMIVGKMKRGDNKEVDKKMGK